MPLDGPLAGADAHARDIAATCPVPDGWPSRGRAVPVKRLRKALRAVGWPLEVVDLLRPQHEHRGPNAGQRTADAVQPTTVAPLGWLVDLARRLGVRAGEVIEATVPD